MENYVRISLETHLFFARIMKEHALFLKAGFVGKDTEWIEQAEFFRQQFEELLSQAVQISSGMISRNVIASEELVTPYTLAAERQTRQLSGISIDSGITELELQLQWGRLRVNRTLLERIQRLNRRALRLLDGLISFKEAILREVGACHLFTANYPLLIEHIMREAKLYRATVRQLMGDREISFRSLRNTENFWNQIMMEHALFIRGLLDPSEEELIQTANGFAMDYRKLLEEAKQQDGRANGLAGRSLEETRKLREFKTAGTKGLLKCEISSIMLPLLADHVLREANHYIRILESGYE